MANRYNISSGAGEGYGDVVRRRRSLASEDSDPLPEVEDDMYESTQIEMPESNASQAAGMSMVGSGNPVAMGVGAGLAVLGEAAKRRDQQKILEYQAKQDRIQRQQQAISRLIGITDSMRAL